MKDSKIIQFLKCLTKQEFREFRKFVKSPYHNNRKEVIRFYETIREYYPDFNKDGLSKENIYEKLYPGKKYDPNVIALLSSYLINLGKDFLTISDFKEDKFFYKYHLLKSLDTHSADNLFEKEFRDTGNFLNEEKFNTETFRNKSLLELSKINFDLRRNRQENTCQNSIEYGDYLIYSFLINLIENYHGLLANKSSFNYDFTGSAALSFVKNFNFEGFIKSMKDQKLKDHNYIVYYYFLFMCNYNPENEIYFSKLKEYSFKDFDNISELEKSNRFNYLIDYCIYKMELGDLKFLDESFQLYVEVLEKKIFQTSPQTRDIGLMFFRNFVTIGLAAKEYEYIEKFIDEYGGRIKADSKNDLLELSYAMLNYERKKYDKALECLSKVSNSIPLFRLSTKHILLKIYYDTDQYDSFFSLTDTYRHYLKNDKIIPKHTREAHTVLLGYAGKLARMKLAGNTEDALILKKEIKENRGMDFRHKFWLMEKAQELMKN